MTSRVREIWKNVRALIAVEPLRRRVALLAATAGSLAVVFAVLWWVQRPIYRPLFTNLADADAAAIVDVLRAGGVAHRIDDGAHAILVPSDRLYDLRLELASRGLPQGGGVGFEIFDRQDPAQSDFVQHLTYQRALQGELARTIGGLGGVASARVHLAMPERSRFGSRDRSPSASVVLALQRGRTIGAEQIDGIVHLVATSVQGLSPTDVTVVDEAGRMLSGAARAGDAPATGLDYQRGIERQAEERIESMLGPVVGPGKAIVRVAATVDLARTEREEEVYDPDKSVLATTETTREEAPAASGAASGRDPASAKAAGAERLAERQSYQVSKTRSRTIGPAGVVTQLSVAVVVDGAYRDDAGTRVFVPRSDEEIEKLKTLVATAVGINEARGDRIEVTSVPFQSGDAADTASGVGQVLEWGSPIVVRLFAVLAVVVALLVVVRPLVQQLAATPAPARRVLRGVFLDRESAVSDLAQENVVMAQQHPERAAQLVRQWLLESGQKPA
jgi:flagellar M-ring protein FliF